MLPLTEATCQRSFSLICFNSKAFKIWQHLKYSLHKDDRCHKYFNRKTGFTFLQFLLKLEPHYPGIR